MSAYSANDYKFPVAYVESIESDEYLVPDLERNKYRITSRPVKGALGKAIYEKVLELAIDVERGVSKRGIAVRVPWREEKAMFVKTGTPLLIYEVGGKDTLFYSYEGDDLTKNDILAYVLTGKGETRTIRVDREATLFYIAWIPGTHPPRYIVVLVFGENLIILEPEQ